MDDARTQQMLDDLADIFLTAPARSAPPRPAAPRPPVPADTAGATPSIRLAPKLTASTAVLEPPSASAPPQAQPALRLAGGAPEAPAPAAERPPANRPRRPVMVQVVFVGNLPGFAGPWLAQYAQHLAEENHAAVAIIRGDAQQIELEVVGGAQGGVGAAQTLPQALDRLAEVDGLAAVLIHIGDGVADERAAALNVDAWTVLCGADDAAIVSTYRMLKQLLVADPQPGRRRVGLMIMGHGEREARQVAENLNVTAASFLRTPVQLLGWRRQMAPVQVQGSASFPAEARVWRQLLEYLHAITPQSGRGIATKKVLPRESEVERPAVSAIDSVPAAEVSDVNAEDLTLSAVPTPPMALAPAALSHGPEVEPSAVKEDATPQSETEATVAATAEMGEVNDVDVAVAEESFVVGEARPAFVGSAARPAAATRRRPSQPVRGAARPAVASDAAPALARYLPGGLTLEARCPDHPLTDLVLDPEGRLHLLRRVDGDGEVAADGQLLRSALVDLMEARRWVRRHRQLLALTQRQCRFDPKAIPVLHLFTDQAKQGTSLVARLGAAVKIHLLQPVRVGGETAWACNELN